MKKFEFSNLKIEFFPNSMMIYWVCKGIGFGTYTLYHAEGDIVGEDNECMNEEFIDALMKEVFKLLREGKLPTTRWMQDSLKKGKKDD